MKTSVSVLIIGILLALPGVLRAEMYSFVDEAGVLHFTNVPNDPRYREIMKSQRSTLSVRHYQFDKYIMEAAHTHGMDPRLIKAVIKAESGFDYLAVSSKGAQGLMQLMPETAREMKVNNPFDPEENIMGGTGYLKKMHRQFNGDLKLALAAYNAGPDRVKNGRLPRIPETVDYVLKVLKNYQHYLATSAFVVN